MRQAPPERLLSQLVVARREESQSPDADRTFSLRPAEARHSLSAATGTPECGEAPGFVSSSASCRKRTHPRAIVARSSSTRADPEE
jgi:hypothetical protein